LFLVLQLVGGFPGAAAVILSTFLVVAVWIGLIPCLRGTRFDRAGKTIGSLLTLLLVAATTYVLPRIITAQSLSENAGPCQMSIPGPDSNFLAMTLHEDNDLKDGRKVVIHVESGRKHSCPYAIALQKMFSDAGWAEPSIEATRLEDLRHQWAVWFAFPAEDNGPGRRFHRAMANLPQDTRQGFHGTPGEWRFYIIDKWPPRIP
jgi:hypothetical protein